MLGGEPRQALALVVIYQGVNCSFFVNAGSAIGITPLVQSHAPLVVHLLIDSATAIAQLSARVKVNEGEPLPIRLHLEYLHLFNPETGDAIGA